MAGGILPLMAKVADMVWNKMYEKLNASPIPKCSPIPPFTFREESESPMAKGRSASQMSFENDMLLGHTDKAGL